MKARITLLIDNKLIEPAKKYAERNKKSLSKLVEEFFKSVITDQNPIAVKKKQAFSLRGSLKLPMNFEYKKAISKGIEDRFSGK